ncbi:UPF0415 protein C7orf25 homolog isoform X3 [Aphidius gifuensis]|nr:UPF0415 protein C7orf25 homolog isoform X3 [Aphidius gifuensis]
MVDRLLTANEPVDVMKPFKTPTSRLQVDIVCDKGSSWIKVIARNAQALTLISLGNSEYGQKSVIDQAKTYLAIAKVHPHRYKSPNVIFHFACGIETILANELEKIGVSVEGQRVDSDDTSRADESSRTNNSSTKDTKEIKVLNLDVSTLLAFVSNMTNGHANYIFPQPLLTLQAEWERCRPVKPILDKLFDKKKLIVCRTAYENFKNIIDIIGGVDEIKRTNELMSKVEIVDDAVDGRILELEYRGKIKNRSRLVFATGESTKSITVSANEGFVRAARMQGIECTVFLHEPRSLSQKKENEAKKITDS